MTWGETAAAGAPASRFRGMFAIIGMFDTTAASLVEEAPSDGAAEYASSECLDLLAADKLVFAATAVAAIAIHVWLFAVRAGTRLHDFDKDGLFDLTTSDEYQSAAVSRPYPRSTTRALMSTKEKEEAKAAKGKKEGKAKEKEKAGKQE